MTPRASGPCAEPPPGDIALLDDFEDNDTKPFKAFEREGWWYVATDETPEGKVSPPVGNFTPEPLPQSEAMLDNQLAAHFTAEGYQEWGVVWGTSLNWVQSGIKCPYNASAFAGLRFRAKGKATLAVKFGIPETVPGDGGGSCQQKCYDTHAKIVRVSENWETYVLAFDRLQQGGWGTEARFDPKRLLNVTFAVAPADLPVDFWVDDLEFVKPSQEPGAAPEGATAPVPVPTVPTPSPTAVQHP